MLAHFLCFTNAFSASTELDGRTWPMADGSLGVRMGSHGSKIRRRKTHGKLSLLLVASDLEIVTCISSLQKVKKKDRHEHF